MDTLEYGAILTGLGGGLALFLYGMRKLTESLKTLAGERMKFLLSRLTTNRFTGILAGAAVTAVIQSSSVTSVLVVGFVSVGLMTFTQSIGVIMGANIGTTITAQIVAFKITEYALLLIAVGFVMELLGKSQRLRQTGIVVMGLGLLFFGMDLMSGAMSPLRTWPPFSELMQSSRNPLVGVLIGFIFTALVQSSSATTGLVIVLAAEGLLTLETGIAIAFGANIGTCVTALLSTIGRPREAVRVAMVHIAFNVLGVVLWIAFIPQIAEVVRAISPSVPELSGAARAAAEAPRQIANAHTVFNIANALIFIWFAHPLKRLIYRLVPDVRVRVAGDAPRYLDEMYLNQADLALDRVQMELVRLGERVERMAGDSFAVVTHGSREQTERLRESDAAVDALHAAIVGYLGRISLRDLPDALPDRIQTHLGIANYLENIGDVIETDLVEIAERRRANGFAFGDDVAEAISNLHEIACSVLQESLAALETGDTDRAIDARERKGAFNTQADTARARAAQALAPSSGAGLEVYRLEMDTIEAYVRLHSLARRVARLVVLGVPAKPGAKTAGAHPRRVS